MVFLKSVGCISNGSDMCQTAAEAGSKTDSDDDFKWEEFFGTSVDITSSLLDMFDAIAAKNNSTSSSVSHGSPPADSSDRRQPTPPPPSNLTLSVRTAVGASAPPCDPGGSSQFKRTEPTVKYQSGFSTSSSRHRPSRLYGSSGSSRRSYSESVFEEKKRPLSTSSVSSSSSSSSSSLPRSGLDVKKPYLASIESLDDDDNFENEERPSTSDHMLHHHHHRGQTPASGGNAIPPTSKPRWCDPNLSHTDRVLLEIVDTERTYVRDLDEIIQGYLKHIKDVKNSAVSCECLEELFSNIEDIYRFNSCFLEELELCGLDPISVAGCFVRNSDGFEVYTQYCTNYPRTVSVLTELMGNSETAEIFKERQVALQHSLPLGSYLLKPVQRILKYHLLLQNLVKHSEKDSNTCADVKNALSVMTGIAYHINDMKRKHEHAVRVQEIQSLLYGWEGQDLTTYGELVAEGAFRMYRAKALRHLFLFDKMLLIAKKKEEGILSYKTHIMCSNLMLIESIQGEPLCFHVIPFDNPRYQYTFQARNLDQKREWCLQLKRVILENYNAVIPLHARQLVMELGQSRMEDSATEKATSKRQLSAPEYLEKRKQERRKSEINLKRGFRIKNGPKKGEVAPSGKNMPSSGRRKSASVCSSPREEVYPRQSWSSQMDISENRNSWSKSQEDMNQSTYRKNGYFNSKSGFFSRGGSYSLLFSRDTRLRHSLPEPSLSQRSSSKTRGLRPSWRTWNSVPEETTDTENEDAAEHGSSSRNFRYQDRSFESESVEEPYDSSGEYVTFFYAHTYATRDMPELSQFNRSSAYCSTRSEQGNQNSSSVNNNSVNAACFQNDDCGNKVSSHSESSSGSKREELASKDNDSESCSSGYSWKQSAAVRRVQSFTGIAKAKMSSLHHNISFKHPSKANSSQKTKGDKNVPLSGDIILPSSSEQCSPTTPATWLKLQEEHLASSGKKSGSLPRSFQLGSESASETNLSVQPENSRNRLRSDSQKLPYIEQRPFTIASDKPSESAFSHGDVGCFVLECSADGDDDYCLLVRTDNYDMETTTGCTNTPAISLENVHSIHPELKIYHQAASKYSTLKQVFMAMSSKIASLRAAVSHSINREQSDSSPNVNSASEAETVLGRSESRSSIKSESDAGPKILTSRLASSVAKAYSAVMRHRMRKCDLKADKKISESKMRKSKSMQNYKSESSLIGARMAHPLESEYSVPKHIVPPDLLKQWKNDLRPDSLFSEYSNVTSSSDGDKGAAELTHDSPKPEVEDSASEASESSADSYYERTFDAIENVLAEDMFRDSAIYSDPDDADFNTEEVPKLSLDPAPSIPAQTPERRNIEQPYPFHQNGFCVPPQLELICKRPVNQAILERLRILEENVKCQREELPDCASGAQKRMMQKKLDPEKWCSSGPSRECEESETSSEHSASTVNTVMESNHFSGERCEAVPGTPRIKGWVKHVVEKLQGEGGF